MVMKASSTNDSLKPFTLERMELECLDALQMRLPEAFSEHKAKLRSRIRGKARKLYLENCVQIKDPLMWLHLNLAVFALAAFTVLEPKVPDRQRLFAGLKESLRDSGAGRAKMVIGYTRDPEIDVLRGLAAGVKFGIGRQSVAAYVKQQEIARVRDAAPDDCGRSFYGEFFSAHDVPELADILCDLERECSE